MISGISYNFGSDGALQQGSGKNGIDVSSHQGNIDWASVKAAGINFAIIRVGYRGSQTGALVEDSCFKKNIQGATANGINVGVYFFTQATTEAEAVEEASMALTLCSGYNLSYPIFVDTENGSGAARANGLDKGTRTACVAAFCKTIAMVEEKQVFTQARAGTTIKLMHLHSVTTLSGLHSTTQPAITKENITCGSTLPREVFLESREMLM